ncbi:MAG TPA: hypothetical protein VNI20_07350 [Fimbriimonadaceae bacterium]|nr:hypothetical protein [Fimbriimonadaceae bacterium]
MPVSILLLAALGASPAPDVGLLVSLRSDTGEYRTVLVGRKGVATVADSLDGVLVGASKDGFTSYTVDKDGILVDGRPTPLKADVSFRIAWMSKDAVGIELDRSRPGEPRYSSVERRVYEPSFEKAVKLSSHIEDTERDQFRDAVAKQRRAAGPEFEGAQPSDVDWGFVRADGHWETMGALVAGDERSQIDLGAILTKTYGMRVDSEVTLAMATTPHNDATDVVASRQARVAVVITPDALYVHDSNGRTVGRMLRRMTARNETVVGVAQGSLDALREYFAAHRTLDSPLCE